MCLVLNTFHPSESLSQPGSGIIDTVCVCSKNLFGHDFRLTVLWRGGGGEGVGFRGVYAQCHGTMTAVLALI